MDQQQLAAIETLAQQENLVVALNNICLDVQKTAVWAIYKDLLPEGLCIANTLAPTLELSEDGLYAVAKLARVIWQLDMPRAQCSNCTLCNRKLPEYPEAICSCWGATWEFDMCPTGWTHDRLNFLIQQYGPQHVARGYYCSSRECRYGQMCLWTLKNMQSLLKAVPQGGIWYSPKNKLCPVCHKGNRPKSNRPPAPRAPHKVSVGDLAKSVNFSPSAES